MVMYVDSAGNVYIGDEQPPWIVKSTGPKRNARTSDMSAGFFTGIGKVSAWFFSILVLAPLTAVMPFFLLFLIDDYVQTVFFRTFFDGSVIVLGVKAELVAWVLDSVCWWIFYSMLWVLFGIWFGFVCCVFSWIEGDDLGGMAEDDRRFLAAATAHGSNGGSC